MSIYAKKQNAQKQKRKFASVDERFMKRAEELLFGELAAVFEISMEEVPAYIERQLKRRERSGEQVREAF
jgi:CarD family transcriptional regulator